MMSAVQPFEYERQLSGRVREDLVGAHWQSWKRLAHAGIWWTGAERIAIAGESRAAVSCAFCSERRAALCSFSLAGAHDSVSTDILPAAAIDAAHRIVTDATRLSQSWVEGLPAEGVLDTRHVELLNVVVHARSIDAFHLAMGHELESFPVPIAGDSTRRRPEAAAPGGAWVEMLPARKAVGANDDLFPGPAAPCVIRAMSLVPEAVRWLTELPAAHYRGMNDGALMDLTKGKGPLDRTQTGLIAGRVSSVNECFYSTKPRLEPRRLRRFRAGNGRSVGRLIPF